MHKRSGRLVVDLLVLVLLTLAAVWVSFVIKANFLTSTILFLGVPSIYLIAVERRSFAKAFVAAIIAGLLCGFVFDFLAEVNHAWSWNGGLFLGQIMGVVQGDVLVWFFLWMLNIFLVYEHFIDGDRSHALITKYGLRSLVIAMALVVTVLGLNKYYPQALHFGKAYLVLCLLIVIPLLYYVWKKPKIVRRTLPITALFTFIYLLHAFSMSSPPY